MVKCLVIACPHLYLVLCTLPRNLFHPCILVLSFAFMVLFECAIIDVCGMVVSTRFCKLLKLGARLAPSSPVWTMYLAGWGLWWPEAYFPASLLGSFWEGEVWIVLCENHIVSSVFLLWKTRKSYPLKEGMGSFGSPSFDHAVQTLEWHRGSDPAESLVTHFLGLSPSRVASSF